VESIPPRGLSRLDSLVNLNSARIAVSVGGHRAEFLYWGVHDPGPWRNYLHLHSFFEVCYAYTGSGVFRTGGQEHAVEAGTLFLARPGDVHEIVSSDRDPMGISFWAFTLIPVRDNDSAQPLLKAFASPGAPVLSDSVGQVPAMLAMLAAEACAPRAGFEDMAPALSRALLVDTARAFVAHPALTPAPHVEPGGQAGQLVQTMRRYIQDNYDRPVSIRDVVAQVHISERHANRLFRQYTGTTIHAYLTRYRLEVASQRLVERDLSIKEVARACGYPDVRHFTTAFRRRWGVTPGEVRARNGTTLLPVDNPDSMNAEFQRRLWR
jgi:AraC-like DNA-binding protein